MKNRAINTAMIAMAVLPIPKRVPAGLPTLPRTMSWSTGGSRFGSGPPVDIAAVLLAAAAHALGDVVGVAAAQAPGPQLQLAPGCLAHVVGRRAGVHARFGGRHVAPAIVVVHRLPPRAGLRGGGGARGGPGGA